MLDLPLGKAAKQSLYLPRSIHIIQLNVVMSKSVYSKYFWSTVLIWARYNLIYSFFLKIKRLNFLVSRSNFSVKLSTDWLPVFIQHQLKLHFDKCSLLFAKKPHYYLQRNHMDSLIKALKLLCFSAYNQLHMDLVLIDFYEIKT